LRLTTNCGHELLVDGLLYGKGVNASSPATNESISRDDWGAAQSSAPQPWQKNLDGLPVNSKLELKENLFAAGDTTRIFDLVRKENDRLPLWPLAGEQGVIAGYNMAKRKDSYPWRHYNGGISCNAFSIFGLDFISASFREIPSNMSDWHSLEEKKGDSYSRLNFYQNQLKGFILSGRNNIKKSGPLLAQIKRQAIQEQS
jgi:hypothetical protein